MNFLFIQRTAFHYFFYFEFLDWMYMCFTALRLQFHYKELNQGAYVPTYFLFISSLQSRLVFPSAHYFTFTFSFWKICSVFNSVSSSLFLSLPLASLISNWTLNPWHVSSGAGGLRVEDEVAIRGTGTTSRHLFGTLERRWTGGDRCDG